MDDTGLNKVKLTYRCFMFYYYYNYKKYLEIQVHCKLPILKLIFNMCINSF